MRQLILAATAFGFGLVLLTTATAQPTTIPASPGASEMLNLGLRGVYFVPNEGQWSDGTICYGFKSRGLDVAFRESSFTMHLRREVGGSSESNLPYVMAEDGRLPKPQPAKEATEATQFESLTLTVTFPGSNRVWPDGADSRTTKFNYFIGDDESKWASNVCSFGSIIYPDLYDGIDLHVCGSDDGVLKYEFHVAPGADYNQICIAYDGIDGLCIDDAGDLQISTAFGTLCDSAPVAWQDIDDQRREVACHFTLCERAKYGFGVDCAVDHSRELVIDPAVEWMLYLGGSREEQGFGIALDSRQNVLATGYTNSPDFEGHANEIHGPNDRDVFVARVTSDGNLDWMTYLGGSGPDGHESGVGIAVDDADSIVIVGFTGSSDFPMARNSPHGNGDAFAAFLRPSGALDSMLYLGGTEHEYATDIVLDGLGSAIVSGYTWSVDFEGRTNSHHGGEYDIYVLRLDLRGNVQWMTYLGGTRRDIGHGVAIDSTGGAIVTGDTESTDFEGAQNALHGTGRDAVVARVSRSGQLEWMLYLGGSGYDYGWDVAVDHSDRAVVVGYTNSQDFEGRENEYHGGINDGFALKIGADGTLLGMQYYGGEGHDSCDGVAVGAGGDAYFTGYTASRNLEGRVNQYPGNGNCGYVMRLSPSGGIHSVLYIGGAGSGGGFDGGSAIAIDDDGSALVTGLAMSRDFVGHRNEYHGGSWDGFVLRVTYDRPSLYSYGGCPSGGPTQLTWADTTPEGRVGVVFARTTGETTIPNGQPCQGTVLGLGSDQRQIVFVGPAGANGSRTLNSNAGPGVCGGYLQLVDGATCRTSNVVQIQ